MCLILKTIIIVAQFVADHSSPSSNTYTVTQPLSDPIGNIVFCLLYGQYLKDGYMIYELIT